MPYTSMTEADKQAMLKVIGVESADELFADIPESIRLTRPLNLPKGMAEAEVRRHVGALAAKNADVTQYACFLGGRCTNT